MKNFLLFSFLSIAIAGTLSYTILHTHEVIKVPEVIKETIIREQPIITREVHTKELVNVFGEPEAGMNSGISTPSFFQMGGSNFNVGNMGGTTTVNLISPVDNYYQLAVGTTSPNYPTGTSIFTVYGTSTIQTPINTDFAFRIFNAASTSVLTVSTQDPSISLLATSTVGTASSTPSQE